MSFFRKTTISYDERIIEGHRSISVLITNDSLECWCLSLQLLRDQLADSIVLATSSGREHLRIELGTANRWEVNQGKGIEIKFGSTTFDYVRHFFLCYYRDGFTAVDHIDVEDERDGGYVTFVVESCMASVSSLEAERRLGLK